MTQLIFIRHAESDKTHKDDFSRPLTSSGIKASKLIPEYFTNIKIDHFYSSPYLRAIETIKPLVNNHNSKIISCDNLKERKIGEWINNFAEYSKKQWENFNFKKTDGESLYEVQNRNISAINMILQKHKDKNIIIGTHGTSLCTILNYYDKKIDFEYFKKIMNKMPLIIKMTFQDNKYYNFEELNY